MQAKVFPFLIMAALLLSACGSFAPGSPAENGINPAPNSPTADALLIWESTGSPCETVSVTAESISYGNCGEALIAAPAEITNHTTRLTQLAELYTSFTAQTAAGNLSFTGSGNLVPSAAEKRAVAEWAKLMFQIAQSGRSGAAWGMAFAWHREAGPGDFCDDVVVYLTGWVTASDCRGYAAQGYLTASQLSQVFAWVDTLASIDHTESFPASTGGLKLSLALTGNGQERADDATVREIFEFSATIYTELGYAAEADAEVEDARQVLQRYLEALNAGDYGQAAQLYSGDTNLLQSWNPDLGNDLPMLLERACTQNGLQCLLPRAITYRAPDSDGGYNFYVEFNNPDNTLFEQGPCCGEPSGSSASMIPFLVEKTANGLRVTDLPPYVP